ncbi:MAG: flavodoxin domain-containing protein [Clostridiales bacterium]|nr:flavodoxin domain-containing protein [Clostridiales bacterium]
MKTLVIYKSKYGSTKQYAQWIAEELGCEAVDAKSVKPSDLEKYDNIVYGGGLYAETINGVSLITKNIDKLSDKRIAVYTTGLTPTDCRDYYDKLIIERNFKFGVPQNVKVFNFVGKMIVSELSVVHRTAINMLKKMMSAKENPTDMERLLVELCDKDGDFTERAAISDLVAYIREGND